MTKKRDSRADRFTWKDGDITITPNPKGRVLSIDTATESDDEGEGKDSAKDSTKDSANGKPTRDP